MAGIQLVKTTVAKVAHMGAHFDEKRRAAESTNHRNKYIDKSKSHLNFCIGASSWKEIMTKAKNLVKEVDKVKPPQRKKSDRVTLGMYDIWCPNEIPPEKRPEFFKKVYSRIDEAFPNSLMGMQVHRDEQHIYIDPRTNQARMSMEHAHAFQAPNGPDGINGKKFFNKNWYKTMNEICKEVAKEFGAKYHTGEGYIAFYEGKTQEDLKVASEKAAAQLNLQEIQKQTTEEMEVLSTLQSNEQSLVERITKAIMEFITQKERKSTIEASVPLKMRNRVFGTANSLISKGEEAQTTIFSHLKEKSPEATIEEITKELASELTRIEADSKDGFADEFAMLGNEELVADDDFGLG